MTAKIDLRASPSDANKIAKHNPPATHFFIGNAFLGYDAFPGSDALQRVRAHPDHPRSSIFCHDRPPSWRAHDSAPGLAMDPPDISREGQVGAADRRSQRSRGLRFSRRQI